MNNSVNPITKRQKSEKFAKRCKYVKKAIAIITMALCIMSLAAMSVFAVEGEVDTKNFIDKTITVLQSVVSLIGAGLAVWGVVNLIEGYSNDNAGAKSQGMKQLMAGLGLILLAIVVVPILGTMMKNAME